MKFFHVYNEDCYKGLEKNGLINKDTGFKIQHVFSVPERLKFNEFAKKGSRLYNMIKDTKIPFYVDRIAGGVTWHTYHFDKDLIREYKDILGDWFLGFQLHESGSNRRRAEWPRTIKVMGGQKGPFDLEELKAKTLLPANKMPGHKIYNFSQDTVEYFATLRYGETYAEFEKEMKTLFQRRMNDTDGNILPCDSYFLATKLQNDMGMRTFMPEVGCQIPLMRLAVSLARGMATAHGKTWGAYYECWREIKGVGYCMPCFNREPMNEWYLLQEQHGDDFSTYGENGGSSRLLQNRIYYHALMSGADYFAEEWGLNCSYTDMHDFTLSKYGQVKKDFINEALKLGKIKAKIPFAIVIPSKYSCIELPDIFTDWNIGEHRSTYMEGPLTNDEKEYFGHIEDVLKLIFARYGKAYGNEGHVLTNSRFGDQFDIVYDDTDIDALKKYEYLIDADKFGAFIKKTSGSSLKVLQSSDLSELERTLISLTKAVMPCYVDGLDWIVSTNEEGMNLLTVLNNEGNERDLVRGDVIHREADKQVSITFKDSVNLKVIYSTGNISIEKISDNEYRAIIPATQLVIFEF